MKLSKSKVRGMLYGAVIGDILGVPYEFSTTIQMQKEPCTGYTIGGVHDQPLYSWSDDTSMTLALIDALCKEDLIYKKETVIDCYLAWYKKGKYTFNGDVFDIGIQTRMALAHHFHGMELEYDDEARGNGGLMRVHPIACLGSLASSIAMADTKLTHNSDYTAGLSRFYIIVLQKLLSNEKVTFEKATKLIETVDASLSLNFDFLERAAGYAPSSLTLALRSALYANQDFESAVLYSINNGYDTDTNGSITGAVAGARLGFEAIPEKYITPIKQEAKDIIELFIKKLEEKGVLID